MATKEEVAAAKAKAAQQAALLASAKEQEAAAQKALSAYGTPSEIDFAKNISPRFTAMQDIAERVLAKAPTRPEVLKNAGVTLDQLQQTFNTTQASANEYAAKVTGITEAEQQLAAAQGLVSQYSTPVYIPSPDITLEEIQAMIDAALAKQKTELLGEQKKLAEQQKKTALEEFKASLTTMGLADLTDTIDEFIKNDYTASQIKLELPKTTAYKTRFPGMEALKTANRAINEATYISNERAYLQTLRAYGLDTATLGSISALGTYIANEVSPREFEERVNLASDRVTQNPDVLNTFKSYYPEADKSSVVAYLLNPKAGIDLVKKQVRVAEIGAAATAAGFKPTTISAAYGETLVPDTGDKTFNTIRAEFQKAKQLSDAQRSLSQIEGQTYSDVEAIEGVVGGDSQKLLASQQRAEREIARFSSRSGVTGSSLGSGINV